MAGQSGTAFPFTAVAVVVAFISSVVLVQKPFDLLRPAETAKTQYRSGRALQVDARLWEDPFTAAQRFEAERVARCKEKPAPGKDDQSAGKDKQSLIAPECDETELTERRSVEHVVSRVWRAPNVLRLLLPVLLPGNPFVGAEEERRRVRYAILAGLDAQGYVPVDAEGIGLIDFEQPAEETKLRPRHVAIPYERLRPQQGSEPEYAEVLLLWVDETGLRRPKLDNFARLLEQFTLKCNLSDPPPAPKPANPCADLVVIGPSSSDALHTAIDDLKAARPGAAGYRYLARARVFNAAATADTAALGLPGPRAGTTQLFDTRLKDFITGELKRINVDPAGLSFRSTIANEDALVELLVDELNLRGATKQGSRIVLLSEWDSLFAQALVERLRARLLAGNAQVRVEMRNYLRGIDGVTTKDDAKTPAAGDKSMVEWPEARDQRDYLRRLADDLAHTEGAESPVSAIGVLGSDVHDKLLALQALRGAFPDKTFFTTDLDARFFHPRTLPFTRNLIVATSLPLAFDDPVLHGTEPPFRDVYQSSGFLAARLAAGGAKDETLVRHVDHALTHPRRYEIGLDGPIDLDLSTAGAREQGKNPTLVRCIGVAAATVTAVVLLLLWPSTPAMRRVRDTMLRPVPKLGEDWRIVASFVVAHTAALMFAFASLIELIWPGHVTILRALGWAALAGALTFVFVYPGPYLFAPGSLAAARPIVRVVIAMLAVALALFIVPPASFSVFEPVFWAQGVSGWPSQLLRLLALMVALAAMDYAWFGTLASSEDMSTELGFDEAKIFRTDRISSVGAWMRTYSIADWHYPGAPVIHFERLWADYRRRGRTRARVARVFIWFVVTGLLVYWLFRAFGGGYHLELPVRGDEHRALMFYTLIIETGAFILLVVATADTTMLACRFARHLTRGRSVYPDHVIDWFAALMGPTLEPAWRTRVDIPGTASQRHTLLDDWIDIQILARRTADIAPLIILPAVVLALIVVAHSRLFDSWAITPGVAISFSFYLLWLVLLATVLKFTADRARRDALSRMRDDLRWVQGAEGDLAKLAKPMEGLIAAVEAERRGAFADLFDQPLLKAILVPLGGAGGVQLLDYFLLAK